MIEGDNSVRKLGLNISEGEFTMKLQKIKKLAQEARNIEMKAVGISPMSSIDKYKEVVKNSYELIDKRDDIKISEIKSLKRFISTKEFLIGIVIGIFGGMISGYLLLFI
nr:hypothetical protein MCFLDGBP_00002 [uncultured Methanosarcinales archaeon]